ncbi:hypothetical protein [Pseudomonas syringae]|uniref:hypothetical protein n=1 Tax=Pseudomonas syringae TaxID=317 RepID=UPI0023F983A7|nr:hypothetical protein [Pseudomonas syringae]MDF7792895.1 hypothetical protein [Pseudomonas syringae]
MSGAVKADLSITPRRSQIFVTISAFAAIGCLAAGFIFLWFEKPRWELPFLTAAVCGALSFAAWCMSHRNVDMSGGQATRLTVSATEMSVEIDARTAVPPNLMQHFSSFFNAVAHRAMLPDSSGVLDESGKIIPDSQAAAIEAVREVNELARKQTDELVSLFGSASRSAEAPEEGKENPGFFEAGV